ALSIIVTLVRAHLPSSSLFFFIHPPPPELYTLSLHDALPIFLLRRLAADLRVRAGAEPLRQLGAELEPHGRGRGVERLHVGVRRSEEHTSELQSRRDLVCRLLLEKKKKKRITNNTSSLERQ